MTNPPYESANTVCSEMSYCTSFFSLNKIRGITNLGDKFRIEIVHSHLVFSGLEFQKVEIKTESIKKILIAIFNYISSCINVKFVFVKVEINGI